MNIEIMKEAIKSAQEGIRKNEGGPFGAAIVKGNELIAVAHNTVLSSRDPTCHAEINAIRQAAKELNTHELNDCELYTTSEPCPVCLAAIYWARITKIYIGLPKEIAANYGFDDDLFYQEIKLPPEERNLPSQTGILNSECESVFVEWKQLDRSLY